MEEFGEEFGDSTLCYFDTFRCDLPKISPIISTEAV
jgi:hypothetical protein